MVGTQVHLAGLRAVGPGGQRILAPASRLTEAQVLASVFRILEQTSLCSLATVAPDHAAHLAPVYFAYSRDLRLYFLSDPRSWHGRHLAANSTMAVCVYDSTQRWGGADCGITLYGTCRMTRGKGASRAAQVYGRRFRSYEEWRAGLSSGDAALGYRFYEFVPSRVKVLDERRLGSAVFAVASVRR